MTTKKQKFINDFNKLNNKIFQFKEGALYLGIEKNSLIAGSVCNCGLLIEYKKRINFNESIETNLIIFYYCILSKNKYHLLSMED